MISTLLTLSLLWGSVFPTHGQDRNEISSGSQLLAAKNADLDAARRAGTEDYQAAVRQWILIIEDWVRRSLGDTEMKLVLPELASLYQLDGEPARAFQIFQLVAESEEVSVGSRLLSINDAVYAGIRGSVSSDELFALTELFVELVDEHQELVFSMMLPLFEQARDIDLFRAKIFADNAFSQLQKSRINPAADVDYQNARVAGALYRKAAGFMHRFMNDLLYHRASDAVFYDGTTGVGEKLFLQGQINSDGARVYEDANEKSNARELHLAAVRALERIFAEPYYEDIFRERPGLTQDAAQLLLREKLFISDSLDSYIVYAYQLAEKVAHVSECLAGFVEVQGMDLTAQAFMVGLQTAEGKRFLDAANALFELAMKLDEQYRPDGFKKLPNYQSAVLFAAENAELLGDYDQVEYYLGILEGVEITGPNNREIQARLAKKKNLRATIEASSDLPAETDSDARIRAAEEATPPPAINEVNSILSKPAELSAVAVESDQAKRSAGSVWWWSAGGGILVLAVIFLVMRKLTPGGQQAGTWEGQG